MEVSGQLLGPAGLPPGTQLVGWLGPSAVLDAVQNIKSFPWSENQKNLWCGNVYQKDNIGAIYLLKYVIKEQIITIFKESLIGEKSW